MHRPLKEVTGSVTGNWNRAIHDGMLQKTQKIPVMFNSFSVISYLCSALGQFHGQCRGSLLAMPGTLIRRRLPVLGRLTPL